MSEELSLKTIMQDHGIVGAGGAGFPSYAKLADGVTLLVINGVECEPLMYTDYTMVQEKMSTIVEGIRLVMEFASVPEALVCIKDYRAKRLGYEDGEELGKGIRIKYVPNVYPMGDEINLIYTATGRLVKPGALPISEGVVVYNIETVYNVARAVHEDCPVTEKWLTVGGDVKEVQCIRVPVGMRICDVFKALNVTVGEHHVVIDGGPSMGFIKNPQRDVVTKTTKSLLILPDHIPAVTNKRRTVEENLRMAASLCCQCTRCTDLCPRHLLGYPLEPHKMVRATLSAAQETPELVRTASLCCSCDICATLACCQGISPMQVIKEYKAVLAKNRIRYAADPGDTFKPHTDREYRMVNSGKWKDMLGVTRFDRFPTYVPDMIPANRVEIRLNGHIGAPSVPVVAVGDEVHTGQVIAKAGNGLSIPQHASIDGHVTLVDATHIVIEA